MKLVSIDSEALFLAPFVWKPTGIGTLARAEATMPGAYVRACFQGTASLGVVVDGTANVGCPAGAMPVIDVSLDHGPFQMTQLTRAGELYTLPLAEGLDRSVPHLVELHFRAAALLPGRWEASTVHLRLAGFEVEDGASLLPVATRPYRAIGFGDSITEGVCVEGLCAYYSDLSKNNARATWFPLVCAALQCEYGQLGTGGQSLTRAGEIPPLLQTWDRFDATTSRLTGGLLLTEPDFVFCCMGTNDFDGDWRTPRNIAAGYVQWQAAVRAACPRASCFCIVPPLGWHRAEVQAAVAARRQAGDRCVHLIDTAPLQDGFKPDRPSALAEDGVHPGVYGNALLAALITGEVCRNLSAAGRECGNQQPR